MKKLGIVIVVYNCSSLLLKQIECIRKFCRDEYDILVVDNSDDAECTKHVEYYSNTNNCIYIKTNASSRNGSDSHAFACNTSYHKFIDGYEYFLYIDHDNFPVKPFSVEAMLKNKIIGGLGQVKPSGKKYFWAGCVMWNNVLIDRNLIDFSTNSEHGLDTGGNLFRAVDTYGDEQCLFLNEVYEQNPNFCKSKYGFFAMINNGGFMHFINSSNWNNSNDNTERLNSLLNILEERISSEAPPVRE